MHFTPLVTVPQYMASQELINEVIVTSDETGTQAMTSKANVEFKRKTDKYCLTVNARNRHLWLPRVMDMTQSPEVLILLLPNHVQEMRQKTALYIVLGIFAIMSGVSAFCYRKTKNSRSRETT